MPNLWLRVLVPQPIEIAQQSVFSNLEQVPRFGVFGALLRLERVRVALTLVRRIRRIAPRSGHFSCTTDQILFPVWIG